MAMLNNQRVFVLEYLKSSHELAESTAIKKKSVTGRKGLGHRTVSTERHDLITKAYQCAGAMLMPRVSASKIVDDRRWVFQAFEVSGYGRVYWLYLCSLLYGMYAIVWDLLSADGPLRPDTTKRHVLGLSPNTMAHTQKLSILDLRN